MWIFSSQQSLEFIPSDTEEVSGAGVAAGAEIGGLDGESTRPGRSCKSCRGSLGVEEGRDCFIRHQVFAESHLDIRILITSATCVNMTSIAFCFYLVYITCLDF